MSDTEVSNETLESGKEDGENVTHKITTNKVVSFHYRLAEVQEDGVRGEWRKSVV